jgi:hypothetical protein
LTIAAVYGRIAAQHQETETIIMTLVAGPFTNALETFVEGCAKIYNDYMDAHFPNNKRDTFEYTTGPKYIRVVKRDGYHGGRSVHCFVDRANGDVLKAAGWKAPAKHARGNILDEHNGLARMKWTGPEYLR